MGSSFLLQCNFNPTYLPKNLPLFYKECLEAWSSFNIHHTPKTKDEVLDEVIWNNQYILINNKPVFKSNFIDAGFITKLRDILTNENKLKNWEFFRARNITASDYFLLMGIYTALPSDWKTEIMSDKTSGSRVKFPDLMSMNTKSVYWEIITKIQTSPTAQIKLNAAFDNTISHSDWQNNYLLPGYTRPLTPAPEFFNTKS